MKILSEEFDSNVVEEIKFIKTLDGYKEANLHNLDMLQKYRGLMYGCKRDLINAKEGVDKIYRKLYHIYKFKKNYTLTGTEVQKYIIANEHYIKKNRLLSLKKLEIEKLEGIIASFVSRGFAIRNAIEIYKLEHPY